MSWFYAESIDFARDTSPNADDICKTPDDPCGSCLSATFAEVPDEKWDTDCGATDPPTLN